MKKIVALVAVLFSVVVPVQSQAAPGERLVIIDSYFDQSKISGSVEFVCLASDKCINQAISKKGAGEDASNHGTIMANLARTQNPTATLVLIQTEEVTVNAKTKATSVTTLNGDDFKRALQWVNANKSNVSAVSFSYNLTGNATEKNPCALSSSGNISVGLVDGEIRTVVSALKSASIPVFAAAGNDNKKKVSYPACIADVVSVGSTANNKYHSIGLDVVGSITNPNQVNYSLTASPWFGSVVYSTSAATVASASVYKASGATDKVVTVLP